MSDSLADRVGQAEYGAFLSDLNGDVILPGRTQCPGLRTGMNSQGPAIQRSAYCRAGTDARLRAEALPGHARSGPTCLRPALLRHCCKIRIRPTVCLAERSLIPETMARNELAPGTVPGILKGFSLQAGPQGIASGTYSVAGQLIMTIVMAVLIFLCGIYSIFTVIKSVATGRAEDTDELSHGVTRRRNPIRFWTYMIACSVGGMVMIVLGVAMLLGTLWRMTQE